MQTVDVLRSKKGFSTIVMILLYGSFIGITAAIGWYMGSESDQLVTTTRTMTGEARLNFIAECIQADFNDVYLQGKFENVIANFLQTQGPHNIDPDSDFISNLGGRIDEYLAQESGSIISGNAATVYAAAYSTIPQISCTPEEEEGAMMRPRLEEKESGVLEVSGMAIGRRIECNDAEDDTNIKVILGARGYRLNTRAVAIFEKAVETIRTAMLTLRGTTSTCVYGSNQWRLPDDAASKSCVLQDWLGDVGVTALIIPELVEETDGISVESASVAIKSGTGQQYAVDELSVVCYGEANDGCNGAGGNTQTCRPENLNIVFGKSMQEANVDTSGGVDLALAPNNDKTELTVTFTYAGQVTVQASSKTLGKLVGDLVKGLIEKSTTKGYVTYSGTTHLCNAFKGRASSGMVSGRVVESNTAFLPGGMNRLTFDFISSSQQIETSDITNDFTCDGKTDMIQKNIIGLMTNCNPTTNRFQITLLRNESTNKLQPKKDDVDNVRRVVESNAMYTTTGESKTVTLTATVEGEAGASVRSSSDTDTGRGTTTPAATSVSPSGATSSSIANSINNAIMNNGLVGGLTQVKNTLDTAASEVATLGHTLDSQALSKTSSAVCKMIGVYNWMQTGDIEKALAALCGLGRIANSSASQRMCSLAGLYMAVKSGSVQAVLAQLANLIGNADLINLMAAANAIDAAVRSGSTEDVLLAAAAVARLGGYQEVAGYLSGAAAVVYTVENGGDIYQISAAFFSAIGQPQMANFFMSLKSLEAAVESGDARAMLRSAGALAQSLGYSGLAQFESTLTQAENAINFIANLDDFWANCNGTPWDLICVTPMVGGGVCEDTWGGCTFSVGLPSFDANLLCNDLFFDMGFQIDCICTYTCPSFPYYAAYSKTVRMDLNQIVMSLLPSAYQDLFQLYGLAQALASGDLESYLMNYCRLDP